MRRAAIIVFTPSHAVSQMTHEQKSEFVFEDSAKNPREKANLISRLFFK